MSAILGPSGAGKTTFLTVLRAEGGGVGRQSGRVLVNGREVALSSLRSITGFVPQEVGGELGWAGRVARSRGAGAACPVFHLPAL